MQPPCLIAKLQSSKQTMDEHDAKRCRFNKFIPPANPNHSNEPEPVSVFYEKQSEVVGSGSLSDTYE